MLNVTNMLLSIFFDIYYCWCTSKVLSAPLTILIFSNEFCGFN